MAKRNKKGIEIELGWRLLNNDKKVIIDEILDILTLEEREIFCCVFGLKKYKHIKRCSIIKTARLLHKRQLTISKIIKRCIEKIKHEKIKNYLGREMQSILKDINISAFELFELLVDHGKKTYSRTVH